MTIWFYYSIFPTLKLVDASDDVSLWCGFVTNIYDRNITNTSLLLLYIHKASLCSGVVHDHCDFLSLWSAVRILHDDKQMAFLPCELWCGFVGSLVLEKLFHKRWAHPFQNHSLLFINKWIYDSSLCIGSLLPNLNLKSLALHFQIQQSFH